MNIIKTKEGWNIIEGDSHVGKWIQDTGKLNHDEFLIPIACANIKAGDIVIDCGALYGDHTIAYAHKVGNEGCVLAIEANPIAFKCLTENAKKFTGPTICMNLALCEFHGGTAVHIMDEQNIGASKVSDILDASYINAKIEKEVRTASIDGIVHDANLDKVNFIKMDVEGWEYKTLLGARRTIEKFKPILLIEMNFGTLQIQGADYKMIYDFLIELNYSWRIVQPELKGGDAQYDVMAWPNLVERLKPIRLASELPYLKP